MQTRYGGGAGFEPALPLGRADFQSAAFNHSATPLDEANIETAIADCKPKAPATPAAGRLQASLFPPATRNPLRAANLPRSLTNVHEWG
jgi:hypothetical protein